MECLCPLGGSPSRAVSNASSAGARPDRGGWRGLKCRLYAPGKVSVILSAPCANGELRKRKLRLNVEKSRLKSNLPVGASHGLHYSDCSHRRCRHVRGPAAVRIYRL